MAVAAGIGVAVGEGVAKHVVAIEMVAVDGLAVAADGESAGGDLGQGVGVLLGMCNNC